MILHCGRISPSTLRTGWRQESFPTAYLVSHRIVTGYQWWLNNDLGSVTTIRQTTADAVLSLAHQEFERYQSTVETKTTVCQITGHYNSPCSYRKACDSLALGTLMRCLFDANLWPISMDTSANIRSVLKCFVSMESLSNGLSSSNHHQCCPSKRLKPASTELLKAMDGLKLSDFCQPEEIFVPK